MSTSLFDLTGKVALVTGSTSGLGRAIAGGLAAAGARVVINGRNLERLNTTVDAVRSKGFKAEGYPFQGLYCRLLVSHRRCRVKIGF